MTKAALILAFVATAGFPQTEPQPTAPAPVPYSLPWQLRPAAVANTIRLDTSAGFWRNGPAGSGHTSVFGLIASRKVSSRLALIARVSWIDNHPPFGSSERPGTAFSNPLLGATFLRTRPGGFRQSLFLAATAPIGSGGGSSANATQTAALTRAIATRSAMDNALFAVNYFTAIGGASLARVTRAATIQVEATVLQLFRLRGPLTQDERRTNFTASLHVGRSFRRALSAGGELRYQRWLSNAAPARANRQARETLTLAIGPRLHFHLGGTKWIRPGVSLTLPLDEPLSGQRYRIVQFDVPVSF